MSEEVFAECQDSNCSIIVARTTQEERKQNHVRNGHGNTHKVLGKFSDDVVPFVSIAAHKARLNSQRAWVLASPWYLTAYRLAPPPTRA
jgi:hypothetical protein